MAFDYEGYSSVTGVFSTREAAEAERANIEKERELFKAIIPSTLTPNAFVRDESSRLRKLRLIFLNHALMVTFHTSARRKRELLWIEQNLAVSLNPTKVVTGMLWKLFVRRL